MEYTPRRKLSREFKLEAVRQVALSEALQVSRSGYYAAQHRGPSDRQKRWVDLTARIRTIHQTGRESYGAPRVYVELLAQKVPCCRNTVAKLMRRAEILPKAIRRFRVTTDSRRTQASPNLIHRDFRSEHPNDLWLSDITYIPTRCGPEALSPREKAPQNAAPSASTEQPPNQLRKNPSASTVARSTTAALLNASERAEWLDRAGLTFPHGLGRVRPAAPRH